MLDWNLFFVDPEVLLGGFLLDFLVGDPSWLPHPVRWIGQPIGWVDRSRERLPVSDRLLGITMGIAYPLIVVLITGGVLSFGGRYSSILSDVMAVFLIWSGLSARSLYTTGREVFESLNEGVLEGARRAVGRMVGRQTEGMTLEGVSRAGIESLAEGYLDSLLSPLFWLLVTGIPGMMAFKTVSTLDSMIGYRSESYREFGKVSARLDDLMNWIPARISLLFVPVASLVVDGSSLGAIRIGVSDRQAHPSPNAGHPEAPWTVDWVVQRSTKVSRNTNPT